MHILGCSFLNKSYFSFFQMSNQYVDKKTLTCTSLLCRQDCILGYREISTSSLEPHEEQHHRNGATNTDGKKKINNSNYTTAVCAIIVSQIQTKWLLRDLIWIHQETATANWHLFNFAFKKKNICCR